MAVPTEDFQSLIVRAQAGDRGAFERALDACREPLEAFVQTRLGGHLREYVAVEDVLQDTYAEAVKTIDRFRWLGERSFLGWLRGIAEHIMLNLARRHRKGAVIYVEHEAPARGPTASKVARRDERLDRLQRALDALPPDAREAVYLVRIEGLKVNEAAERMGRSPKAVSHLLSRALDRLRRTFGDTESLSLPPSPLIYPGGEDGK